MSDHTWEDFPVYEAPTERACELPEVGFGAVVAWVLGPTRAFRVPSGGLPRPFSREQSEIAGVLTSETRHPRTPEEQALIDDGIDHYVSEAGIPSPPRGFRWFAMGEDQFKRLNRAIWDAVDQEGGSGTPSEILEIGQQVLRNHS